MSSAAAENRMKKKATARAEEDVEETLPKKGTLTAAASDSEDSDSEGESERSSESSDDDSSSEEEEPQQQTKKAKKQDRAREPREVKPLPEGYICNACKQPGHAIYDCPLKVSKKVEKKEKRETLFMSRLPKKWDEDAFLGFMRDSDVDMDTVTKTKLVTNTEGAFSGVVLLTVTGNETLSKVLQLNGQTLAGRNIIVKIDEPQKKKKQQQKHCARCGGLHDITACTNSRICYKCKGTDHISIDCPKKSNKRSYDSNF